MTSKHLQAASIEIDKFKEYLNLTGWRLQVANERWLVFLGTSEAHTQGFEVVLVADPARSDYWNYLQRAVELLSALNNEDSAQTLRRIQFVDTDVLSVRNVETGGYDSISLELADRQVTQLKQLIKFAASSEKEPRPFFNQSLRIGEAMAKHYRFGQTFRGSFGYTIQSPLRHLSQRLMSQQPENQPSLFDEEPESFEDIILPPFERRVMERVVRGLENTRLASSLRSPEILVTEYGSGLNGNMCLTLIRAAHIPDRVMEYSVLWSPRVKPTEGLDEHKATVLNEVSYGILAAAAEELRTIQPEVHRIRGRVTNLGSESDPLSESTATREVAIKWTNRPEHGRPVKVIVRLDREDYVLAHKAHLSWSTVEVTGVVEKVGPTWRLVDPKDFTVENLPRTLSFDIPNQQ